MKTKTTNCKLLAVIISAYLFSICGIMHAKPWKDRVVDSLQQFVLPSQFLYGVNEWAIGDCMSDNAELGGADHYDHEPMQQMCAFNIKPAMEPVFTYYRWNYFGIGLCNQYLKNFGNISSPSAADNVQKGEILFLRALFYFNLVRLYGGVPIFTESEHIKS